MAPALVSLWFCCAVRTPGLYPSVTRRSSLWPRGLLSFNLMFVVKLAIHLFLFPNLGDLRRSSLLFMPCIAISLRRGWCLAPGAGEKPWGNQSHGPVVAVRRSSQLTLRSCQETRLRLLPCRVHSHSFSVLRVYIYITCYSCCMVYVEKRVRP